MTFVTNWNEKSLNGSIMRNRLASSQATMYRTFPMATKCALFLFSSLVNPQMTRKKEEKRLL